MATRGELLASARGCGTIDRWLTAADPRFANALSEAAARSGDTPDQFARVAVASFSRLASDEAWTTLMARICNARDPAVVCLEEIARWYLTHGDGAIGARG